MSLAHSTHGNGNLVETQRHPVEEVGKLWSTVDGKVVRAVQGTVGGHSELDAEGLQHFLGGNKSLARVQGHIGGQTQGSHRSSPRRPASHIDAGRPAAETESLRHRSVGINGIEIPQQRLLVGSGDHVISGSQTRELRPKPVHRGHEGIVQFGNSNSRRTRRINAGKISSNHLGQRSDVFEPTGIEANTDNKPTHSGSVDQFKHFFTNSVIETKRLKRIVGQKHRGVPEHQRYFQQGTIQQCQVFGDRFGQKRLSSFVTYHWPRLAEHEPSIEVACPGCGQRLLDNGWTGFTPVYPDGYGERTWQCPTCLNDLKEIHNRPQRTAGSWDPTTCEHCRHPMTDPKMIGNKWMNYCTNCGKYREVPTQTPLLQQQMRNWPPYPAELQSVDPGRAWMAVGKFAEVSGGLSQRLSTGETPVWKGGKHSQVLSWIPS